MKKKALNYLREGLNKPEAVFQAGQWECIEKILNGGRIIVIQRTGWGKSMVYFLATKLLREQGKGPTLLISPLLPLMRNQVEAAERIGVVAETMNSRNKDLWPTIEQRLLENKIDVLIISPEHLANEVFQERHLQFVKHPGLFVIDEAHCISDWGHDFRPDYRYIGRILRSIPKDVPVLATTATANKRVSEDIAVQIGNVPVERGPLVRESLRLQNIWLSSPTERMAWLAEHLNDLPGHGIIYTLTVRDANRVAKWLQLNGHHVEAYHSKLDSDEEKERGTREKLEGQLMRNEVKALVATVALGMGFDKPDLGFVVHFQRPSSVVHYYQQVGRAGRSLDNAYGVLLSGDEDSGISDYFIASAFPEEKHISEVLRVLSHSARGESLSQLEQKINLPKKDIQNTVKYLASMQPAPVEKIRRGGRMDTADSEDTKSAKKPVLWRFTGVPYVPEDQKIASLEMIRKNEQAEMLQYMKTDDCLMEFLEKALDDPFAKECDHCANCEGKDFVAKKVSEKLVDDAVAFLRDSYQTFRVRKKWPASGMFEHYAFSGIKIKQELLTEQGRSLCLWGDEGWGKLVYYGAKKGRFSDKLVDGCLAKLKEWNLHPSPVLVTFVPSLRFPTLMPDLAKRLAAGLGVPFQICLERVMKNERQNCMHNSYHKAKNLDGVFRIIPGTVPQGPVLLVDDVVDSGWTFTITGALLREAGCTAVHPFALAVAAPRDN